METKCSRKKLDALNISQFLFLEIKYHTRCFLTLSNSILTSVQENTVRHYEWSFIRKGKMILNRLNIANKQSTRYFPKSPTRCNVLKWNSNWYLSYLPPVSCLNLLILLVMVKYPQTDLSFRLSEAVLHCIFDILT